MIVTSNSKLYCPIYHINLTIFTGLYQNEKNTLVFLAKQRTFKPLLLINIKFHIINNILFLNVLKLYLFICREDTPHRRKCVFLFSITIHEHLWHFVIVYHCMSKSQMIHKKPFANSMDGTGKMKTYNTCFAK